MKLVKNILIVVGFFLPAITIQAAPLNTSNISCDGTCSQSPVGSNLLDFNTAEKLFLNATKPSYQNLIGKWNMVTSTETLSTMAIQFSEASQFGGGKSIKAKFDFAGPPSNPLITQGPYDVQAVGDRICTSTYHYNNQTINPNVWWNWECKSLQDQSLLCGLTLRATDPSLVANPNWLNHILMYVGFSKEN